MFDENRAVRELERLANSLVLVAKDYERLAMAVFGEMLAKDAERAEAYKQQDGRTFAYFAYGDPVPQLKEGTSLTSCWRRLQQDLYEGNPEAFTGVQQALLYAKQTGLLQNPRWGGPQKREVERLFYRRGRDPYAPPGLRTDLTKPTPNTYVPPPQYVAPDVSSSAISQLPIGQRLGIADVWVALIEDDRKVLNGMLSALDDDASKLDLLETLAGDRLHARENDNDLPRGFPQWWRDFPRSFVDELDKLPKRSQAIIEYRYSIARDTRLLHNRINNEMIMSRGRLTGAEILEMVTRHVCQRSTPDGALADYEMRHDQGKLTFPTYLELRERHIPKLATAERELAARHAKQQLAEVQARGYGKSQDQAMTQSHRRLRAETFLTAPAVTAAVLKEGGTLQTLSGGTSYIVYDEYYVIIDRMPRGVTPEGLVTLLATNLNGTVNDGTFNAVNYFRRRNKGAPTVGEIVDIDIAGPINGSVILSELTPTYFVYSCITTEWAGEHPEYGHREFGVQKLNDGSVKVYTRGVSSPAGMVSGVGGSLPQMTGWSRLMKGIANTIVARGGSVVDRSFKATKWKVDK